MRTVLAIALLAVVVTAGCAGPADDPPTETPTQIAERATTATATATGEPPATRQTETTETLSDADSETRKGDQFLSVMEVDESEAMAWNSSDRAAFENLSTERRRVVREAVECGCNVALDGEFSFHDDDRIEVVAYEGAYYFLRVAIV